MEAVRAGSAGNGLAAGVELQLSTAHSAVQSIFSSMAASGGNEREDDETYRERIRSFGLATVSTGSERQYEAGAMAVSSEIVDAKAVALAAGEVGVYLILSDEASPAAILTAVEAALSAKDARPLTDEVSVHQAAAVAYTLNVQYSADGSSGTAAAIAAAVENYQTWQDNTIGRAWNPDRLMAAIYQAGATRAVWGAGSEFGEGGSVEYTEIEETERCKGTITLSTL